MSLVLFGCVLAWLAALAGLALAVGHVSGRCLPHWVMWTHPCAATVALVCLWVTVVNATGPRNLMLNSGVFVLTLAWVAGVFLFALRRSGLRRMPAIVIGPHALVALVGCGLLVAGLVHA